MDDLNLVVEQSHSGREAGRRGPGRMMKGRKAARAVAKDIKQTEKYD